MSADLQLYDIDDAAALLKVTPHWLQTKVTKGEIPHTRVGRFVRFSKDNLREIQQPIRPITEHRAKQQTTGPAADRQLRSA
jgi:excisionase family DNA binding protein